MKTSYRQSITPCKSIAFVGILLLGLSGFSPGQAAGADLTLVMKTMDVAPEAYPDRKKLMADLLAGWENVRGVQEEQEILFQAKGDKIKISGFEQGDGRGGYMLIEGDTYHFVQPAKKEVMTFSRREVAKTAKTAQSAQSDMQAMIQQRMQEQLAKTKNPAERQRMLQSMQAMQQFNPGMANMLGMGAAGPSAPPQVKKLATESIRIKGQGTIRCDVYRAVQEQKKAIGCVTQKFSKIRAMMEKFNNSRKSAMGGLGQKKQKGPRDAIQEQGFPLAGYRIKTGNSGESHIDAFRVLRITEASIPNRIFSFDPTYTETNMDQKLQEQRQKMQQYMNR